VTNIDEEYYGALNAMTTPGGASQEEIKKAEQELGVVFPEPYRQFLAKYGAGYGNGFELAGIFEHPNKDEPPGWISVVLKAKRFRKALRGRSPDHLIPFSSDGHDTTFYIDTRSANGEIIAYGPGIDGHVIATSFREFVVKSARGEL
jgi:cell wall assembly regulator SMI1